MPSSPRPSSPVEVPEYDTQFEPKPDDDDTLWSVLEIVREDKHRYLVKWEGVDPKTGESWDLSWVPKHDCTDALIREWKITKAKKAQTKKKKRNSKVDPDYNPKSSKKSRKGPNSGRNSRSATASSHKPSSAAGPSRLRSDSTAGKVSPVVEIVRPKKRLRESRRSDAGSATEVDVDEGAGDPAPIKKKRKVVATEMSPRLSPTRYEKQVRGKPDSKLSRGVVDIFLTNFGPQSRPSQPAHQLPQPAVGDGEEDDGEDPPLPRKKERSPTRGSSPSSNPRSQSPQEASQSIYELDPRRKIGKRPIIISSLESGATQTNNDDPADDDPIERTFREDDLVPDPYIPGDDGEMDAYMQDDGPPMIDDGYVPPEPDAGPAADGDEPCSVSPPDPRAWLYSTRKDKDTDTIIPETQLSVPSPQAQPQPQPSRTRIAPQSKGAGQIARVQPKTLPVKPHSSKPLAPVPVISPSMFQSLISVAPNSQLSSIDTLTSPSKSQAPARGKGKANQKQKAANEAAPGPRKEKRLAYSQRQEEEESESEDAVEEEEDEEDDLTGSQTGLPAHDSIEDNSLSQGALDETLRLNGERLSLAAHAQSLSQRRPKRPKRPLSEVLSEYERSSSVSGPSEDGDRDGDGDGERERDSDRDGSGDMNEGSAREDVVQQDVSREATASVDDVQLKPRSRQGVMGSFSKLGRGLSQLFSGRSSAEDQEEEAASNGLNPRRPEAITEEVEPAGDQSERRDDEEDLSATERDESTHDHAPDAPSLDDAEGVEESQEVSDDSQSDELTPEDAPDHVSTPKPPDLSLSGEVNYSLEATGPYTQNSHFQNPTIESPTKQLDHALGLLHRKSDEIQDLRESLDAHASDSAKLRGESERLRARLDVAERRYGVVSAELDLEREAKKVLEEREAEVSVAPSVDANRLAELLQENEQLKAANTHLESDTDMLRRVYAQASDAYQTLLEENRALSRDNESRRAQATTGVQQAGVFWQTQVRTLETELARARGAIKVLSDQAQKTGDDVRRRAALLPMAQRETADAREEVEEWKDKVRELGRENTRLRIEVKGWEDEAMLRRKEHEIKRKDEEAAMADELVWMCPWMDEEHRTKCAALLDSREKLREHFYEAGHI